MVHFANFILHLLTIKTSLFVRVISTVIVAITLVLGGDAVTVITSKLSTAASD